MSLFPSGSLALQALQEINSQFPFRRKSICLFFPRTHIICCFNKKILSTIIILMSPHRSRDGRRKSSQGDCVRYLPCEYYTLKEHEKLDTNKDFEFLVRYGSV